MIMYNKQNFVFHRLGNHELRKTFTSATFLATIETIQLTVLNDVKNYISLVNKIILLAFASLLGKMPSST